MPLPLHPPVWVDDPNHHRWLAAESDRLLDFYQPAAANPSGGYFWLGDHGRPRTGQPAFLWLTARLVHCFALAELLGRPGSGPLVEHGLRFLTTELHDAEHDGWRWSVGPGGAADGRKEAYGHAFVLLAASTAAAAGHPAAGPLLDHVTGVLDRRFWRDGDGRFVDRYSADWADLDGYRGANSNMHGVEALMAAAEVTGDAATLARAVRIAEALVRPVTGTGGWRLPEHYDADWQPRPDFHRDRPRDPFRPYGSCVGHWLEWSRLLTGLHDRLDAPPAWLRDAAATLFHGAVTEGWDPAGGGFYATVGPDGAPSDRDRYFWAVTEGIGAAVNLWRATGDRRYADWYRRLWDFADAHLIDRAGGGWHHQLDPDNRPTATVWAGKPDLYHNLQATLYARIPPGHGLAAGLRARR